MSAPVISVVIPTYNRAQILCRTIDNVLQQTYTPSEVIVVDDGSTDDTLQRLDRYGSRLKVICQPNAGPAAARNRGIEMARGEFIAFQDSDDLWGNTKLERQVLLLQKAGPQVPVCICNAELRYVTRPHTTAFAAAWLFPPYEEGLWTNPSEVFATRFVWFCQTSLIRREVLSRTGGFDPALKYHEDYDLPLRLAMEGPWAYIREPLTIWHEGSLDSWSHKAEIEESTMKLCEIRVREKALISLRSVKGQNRLKGLLQTELYRNRWQLGLARWGGETSSWKGWISSFAGTVDRYARAFYRRSPWYPGFDAKQL